MRGVMGHGTRACYVRERCRCAPCRRANSAYQTRLTRDTAYGRVRMVDAKPARDHIIALGGYGLGDRRIAELAELDRKAVMEIRTGATERVQKATAAAILAIGDDPEVLAADRALIDATKTWRRLHALEALGYPKSWIAHQLGFKTRALQINKHHVTAANARAVKALAARVGDKPGPSQRTRDRAENLGYLDPAYYNEQWELLPPAAPEPELVLDIGPRPTLELVPLSDLTGEAGDWRERGVCAQTDPEAFFPEKGGSSKEAKAMCARCDVTAECLKWALDNSITFGIWGGLSERERRQVRKSEQPAPSNRDQVHAEIRRLIEEGLTSKVIAERTKVNVRTVERLRKQQSEEAA